MLRSTAAVTTQQPRQLLTALILEDTLDRSCRFLSRLILTSAHRHTSNACHRRTASCLAAEGHRSTSRRYRLRC